LAAAAEGQKIDQERQAREIDGPHEEVGHAQLEQPPGFTRQVRFGHNHNRRHRQLPLGSLQQVGGERNVPPVGGNGDHQGRLVRPQLVDGGRFGRIGRQVTAPDVARAVGDFRRQFGRGADQGDRHGVNYVSAVHVPGLGLTLLGRNASCDSDILSGQGRHVPLSTSRHRGATFSAASPTIF
jgi:hypothetical protein